MNEFDRIIGYSDEKKELEQIADVLKNGDVYEKLGIKAPAGMLLFGMPGVGKTLMSECLIKASGRPFVVCRKNKPDGEFVNEIKSCFDRAVELAPSIIFLDDIDKFANEDDAHCDAEEYVTIQSCIDEIKGKDVFVLATANNLAKLPDSLLRAGRFGRSIRVAAPSGNDAVEIISHYLEGKSIADDIDGEYIAKLMHGSSCAKLETILNEAGLYAGLDRADKINMNHFTRAYLRDKFGTCAYEDYYDNEDDCDEQDESIKQISYIVYHEAGHAVMCEILDPGSVMFITAKRPGSNGHGGFTACCSNNSFTPVEKSKIRIAASLGGAAAVEQKYGINAGGTSDDYRTAYSLMRDLIEDNGVCGLNLLGFRRCSEALMREQEIAASAELEKFRSKAKEIISRNMELLDKLSEALAQKKILTAPEIQQIKATCKITTVSL